MNAPDQDTPIRRVLCIVNPAAAAGRARVPWEGFRVRLRDLGVEIEEEKTEGPGHAVELARKAAGQWNVVAAVGGDGTVNEVASGLLAGGGSRTLLGVVPVGTGNDVATQLGIGQLADALEAFRHGRTRDLDVIAIDSGETGEPVSRVALLYASVGFIGEVLQMTTARVKRFFGPRWCYAAGFFRALASYRSPRMRVRSGQAQFEGRLLLVSAGNTEWVAGGRMRLSPGALPDDGLLNVLVVEQTGRLELARWFPRLLKGTHIEHPKAHYFTGARLTVECDPPLPIQVDGEVFGQTPAAFVVRPRALEVLVASARTRQ